MSPISSRAFILFLSFYLLFAPTLVRAEDLPGATLESLIEVALKLSPEIAARNLDAAAAEARIEQAGALPDPSFTITSDEIDRTGGSRQNKFVFTLSQEIPLWGKRELRRSVAEAERDHSRATARQIEAELLEKVTSAFGDYYEATQAITLLHELHQVTHDIAAQARARYAQGRAGQQEVFKAEVEAAAIAQERNKYETARQRVIGLLNTLLDREPDAALAPARDLPALPSPESLTMEALLERARRQSPMVLAAAAAASGAEQERALAGKSWYPDVTLSAGAIERGDNGPPGYHASIGVKVPLQWGARNAEVSAASAKLGASRARQDAALRELRQGLVEAVAALQGAQRNEAILREQVLPNADASFASARGAYGLSRAELLEVLTASHDLARARLGLLSAQVEQRKQLAVIERLIGGRP